MKDKLFIGADVSKEWIDVAIQGHARTQRIANTEAAIRDWVGRLDVRQIGLFVFEPTGGYERLLQRCLRDAGITFARVHPNEVVAFRRRRGVKAKTDVMDARLLADFAALELSGRGLAAMIAADEGLAELVSRRRQLMDTLQAERCRAALAANPVTKASFKAISKALTTAYDLIEAAIERHISQQPELARMAALLRSLKCVGPVTVHTILAELPELGVLTSKQIAALVGLAPQQRESGKQRGRAATGHGRPGVRRVLFNAARIAIRHNPVMRAFYQRLVEQNGRPGKVALMAVMRKMLVTLNAIARDQKPWHGSAATTEEPALPGSAGGRFLVPA
jgi:transposase